MVMVMVVIMRGDLQEIRIDIELGIEVETPQIEHLGQAHLSKVHHLVRCAGIHVLEPVLQRVQCRSVHQIRLADENLVGKTHLPARFLAVVELGGRMLGIHQGEDGVQEVGLGNLVVHEKGLRHRSGIGQAGRLDDHPVEHQLALATLLGQLLQGGTQILADGAADAAIAHLDDLLLGVRHQDVVVDVLLTELVFDHGNLQAMGLGQHALEQRGLARAQKAGEDGDRDEGHGMLRDVSQKA